MSKKTCLIVDDENQDEIFRSGIKEKLKISGYDVDLIFIHTTRKEVLNKDQDIDIEKLSEYIKQQIKDAKVDIAVTDFNLSDDNVNGLHVIEIIRKLRPKVPIVLYSGKREEVIKSVLFTEKKNEKGECEFILKPAGELIKGVKSLMLYNISEFADRPEYPACVNHIIKKKDNTAEQILLRKLRDFSQEQFKSCYPSFTGKTFKDIALEIEKGTVSGQKFQSEIMEQILSYMIDINKN